VRRIVITALVLLLAAPVLALLALSVVPDELLVRGGYEVAGTRLVTGMTVVGTPRRPVIYVTSSDPRIGAGESGEDLNLDTNSGVVSRLTRSSSGWTRQDLVRGLPRSEENHATNGLALDAGSNTLYAAQGSNTNAGAPSHHFAQLPEYALSGAVLAVDLDAIGERTVIFEGSAAEAVRLFPANVNVAAALSLAGLGAERTGMQVVADPTLDRNVHEVVARGSFGELRLRVANVPSPANPKTSFLACLSALATLRRLAASVQVG
jgi:hypothetical protein